METKIVMESRTDDDCIGSSTYLLIQALVDNDIYNVNLCSDLEGYGKIFILELENESTELFHLLKSCSDDTPSNFILIKCRFHGIHK